MDSRKRTFVDELKDMRVSVLYARDIRKPEDAPDNLEVRHFKSRWAMCWFVLRDPVARAAVFAERFQYVYVGDPNR